MKIDDIKMLLSEPAQFSTKKSFLILEDMQTPMKLVNGHAITAVSRKLPDDGDERTVANYLFENADWVAFYQVAETLGILRMAYGKFADIGITTSEA